MAEELLKNAISLLTGIILVFAGAISSAFIPLLHSNKRRQQEIELSIKEIDRIEKLLTILDKNKDKLQMNVNIIELARLLDSIIAQISREQFRSEKNLSRYLNITPNLFSAVFTSLPRIDGPPNLADQIVAIKKARMFAVVFNLLIAMIVYFARDIVLPSMSEIFLFGFLVVGFSAGMLASILPGRVFFWRSATSWANDRAA